MRAEVVDLITCKAKLPVRTHRLRIAFRAFIVMLPVYLNDDAGMGRGKEQEVHPLAEESVATSVLDRHWIVVEPNFREKYWQSRDSRAERSVVGVKEQPLWG